MAMFGVTCLATSNILIVQKMVKEILTTQMPSSEDTCVNKMDFVIFKMLFCRLSHVSIFVG